MVSLFRHKARAGAGEPGAPPDRRLTSPWIIASPLLCLLALSSAFGDVFETDVYWHIRMGQDILENFRFTGDPQWVYGPGDGSWVTTQWLAEVVLFLVHSATGWTGIAGLRAVLAFAFMASILLAIRQAVPRPCGALVLAKTQTILGGLSFLVLIFAVQERPQTVTFIVLPWVGIMLLRFLYTGDWPRWWVVGPLVVVWSWVHGGALILIPAFLGIFMIRYVVLTWRAPWVRSLLQGLPLLVAIAVAPMLSPVGPAYYRQAFLIQEASRRYIVEWEAAQTTSLWLIVWLILLTAWVVLAGRLQARLPIRRVPRILVLEGLWLVSLLAISLTALRYIPIAFLLALPLVARRLALDLSTRRNKPISRIPRLWLYGVVVVAVADVLVTIAVRAPDVQPVNEGNPVAIFEGLRESTGDRRVLVGYNISGMTQILTRPGVSTSLDGRSDRYGPWIEDYLVLSRGEPGWEEVLKSNYADTTDTVMDGDSPLVELLEREGWTLVCENGDYVWLTAPGYSGKCTLDETREPSSRD
jgi:hypothetical protein